MDTKLEMARTTGLAALHRTANTQSIVFPAPERWSILRPSQPRGALIARSARPGACLRNAAGPLHLQPIRCCRYKSMKSVQGLDVPQMLEELKFAGDAVFTDVEAFCPAFKH